MKCDHHRSRSPGGLDIFFVRQWLEFDGNEKWKKTDVCADYIENAAAFHWHEATRVSFFYDTKVARTLGERELVHVRLSWPKRRAKNPYTGCPKSDVSNFQDRRESMFRREKSSCIFLADL